MFLILLIFLLPGKRNSLGPDRLYVHKSNPLFAFFKELYDTDALDKVCKVQTRRDGIGNHSLKAVDTIGNYSK